MLKKVLSLLTVLAVVAFTVTACSPAGSSAPAGGSYGASRTVVVTPTPTVDPDAIRDPINKLIVHFIDVGSGESILIQTPNSINILIDGGQTDQGVKISTYMSGLGIKKIDYIILSCPLDDRQGGLSAIINNFKIGRFYMPQVGNDIQSFTALMDALNAKKVNPLFVRTGTVIEADTDVRLSVVAPTLASYDFISDYSVALRLLYKNSSMLFMGGGGEITEAQMIADNSIIKADLLKIGNYGVYRSCSAEFLARVAPKYAVLFPYNSGSSGLPNLEVLYRLTEANIELYKTEGATAIATCDGEKIEFNKKPVDKVFRPEKATVKPPVAKTSAPSEATPAPATATPAPTATEAPL